MKKLVLAIALAATMILPPTASNATGYLETIEYLRDLRAPEARSNLGAQRVASLTPTSVRGVGPRPRKWCGWWMRTQLGGGPQFNVAWNWRKYGSPTSPQVGAVVVWRHHVGIITGRASNGKWIVKSGNDGGRVRERARSVAGAIFRI